MPEASWRSAPCKPASLVVPPRPPAGARRGVTLGHASVGLGISGSPNASGLGSSADGRTLVVANKLADNDA